MKGSAVRVRASASLVLGDRGSWCGGCRATDPGSSAFREAREGAHQPALLAAARGLTANGLRGERRVVRRDEGEGSMLGLMFLAWLLLLLVVVVDYRRG